MENTETSNISIVNTIRNEFAEKNSLVTENLNEMFKENEVLRQSYLDFFAQRYFELVN